MYMFTEKYNRNQLGAKSVYYAFDCIENKTVGAYRQNGRAVNGFVISVPLTCRAHLILPGIIT
jgi:hypothetical protein